MFEIIRANQLNIMLMLCGACAGCVFLLMFTRFLPARRKKILIMLELIAFFLLWFDRLAYVYHGDMSTEGYVMVRVSNFFVYFLTSAVVLGFNFYLSDWFLSEGEMSKVPKRLTFVQYTSMIGMTLAVISAFTGLYYYFDDTNIYHRGQGFLIAYIIPIICPIIQYTVFRQYKKLFSKIIYTSLVLFIYVPIACGILQIFTYGISIVNIAMVAVTLTLYLFAYLDINDTVERAHEIEMQNAYDDRMKMQRLFSQTATAFVSAVEKKDDFVKGNSVKVAEYARKIAALAGKDEDDCEKVYYAGLLHDVGLIGIPDSVIKNSDNPTESDFETMHQKPVIGNEILSSITEYPYLSVGAHYSHERYNGTGYPEGLKKDEIPEIARIIAVADAYVTMTTKKRWREARPSFLVREEFVKGGGEKFDPVYSELMIKIIDSEENEKAQREEEKLETRISCHDYREQVSIGIPIESDIMRVTFSCEPIVSDEEDVFSAPSVILFDSYDKRVHDNKRTVEAYQYLEFAELWFDEHSVDTAATRIEEKTAEEPDTSALADEDMQYEIIMGRYEDHLKLKMFGPSYKKEVTVALPGGSKAAYIALTGENCVLNNIKAEKTGKSVGPDDITRIADRISYIDRMESDLANIQVDRTKSASTDGVELRNRLMINFHAMSLPESEFVWDCPYIILFCSKDGEVSGEDYREYALIKLYGENEGDNEFAHNSISVKRTDEFHGWDKWKEINKAGLEYEVMLKKKDNRIVLKTRNLGIELENITTITGDPGKVYVALTGDQVAITDIRVR